MFTNSETDHSNSSFGRAGPITDVLFPLACFSCLAHSLSLQLFFNFKNNSLAFNSCPAVRTVDAFVGKPPSFINQHGFEMT